MQKPPCHSASSSASSVQQHYRPTQPIRHQAYHHLLPQPSPSKTQQPFSPSSQYPTQKPPTAASSLLPPKPGPSSPSSKPTATRPPTTSSTSSSRTPPPLGPSISAALVPPLKISHPSTSSSPKLPNTARAGSTSMWRKWGRRIRWSYGMCMGRRWIW